jgi:aminoglycoside 6'-N-acetyltransferase
MSAAPLHGEKAVLRLATTDDADLLVEWHADPDVARYWDGKTYSREEMRARLARPHVDAYIVELDGEPVGYLQAWHADETSGLDMFLVPPARGRGIGPDAARALARSLVEQGRRRVTVDPYAWNDVAVRAWTKAGFRVVRECEPDDEHRYPWLLMELA